MMTSCLTPKGIGCVPSTMQAAMKATPEEKCITMFAHINSFSGKAMKDLFLCLHRQTKQYYGILLDSVA